MPTTAKSLVDAANAVVPKISGKDAIEMVGKGDAVLIDIRDSAKLALTVHGSFHDGSIAFFPSCPALCRASTSSRPSKGTRRGWPGQARP